MIDFPILPRVFEEHSTTLKDNLYWAGGQGDLASL
jgi:hypothetical protein